jgi:hypothetical protein
VCYLELQPVSNIPLSDGAIMTFEKPAETGTAKLFIQARNSLWLDYVYKHSHELFGGYYDNWTKHQKNADPHDLIKWELGQKIPLLVYVERNGEWVFNDYYNVAGSASFKNDVITVDLKDTGKGPLKIKLESGTGFWEIDYVGIDYSKNVPVDIKTVKIDKAITNSEDDVTRMLRDDDLMYYVQPEVNNCADLTFKVPPVTDSKRTVILHSKGHYDILSDGKGLPKIKALKKLQEDGQFLEYSRELMKTELAKIGLNK